MNTKATIVVLNGAGSAGKSSIAKELQRLASRPFLHVQMDMFITMLPLELQDHPDGFAYEAQADGEPPQVAVRSGPVGARLLDGMRHAIAAMAATGNNLIVDDVLCNGEMPEYVRLLSRFDLHLVGIAAPLEVLEQRERERGDRMIGLARWQHDRVHAGIDYDLLIDTSKGDATACATIIAERLRL